MGRDSSNRNYVFRQRLIKDWNIPWDVTGGLHKLNVNIDMSPYLIMDSMYLPFVIKIKNHKSYVYVKNIKNEKWN